MWDEFDGQKQADQEQRTKKRSGCWIGWLILLILVAGLVYGINRLTGFEFITTSTHASTSVIRQQLIPANELTTAKYLDVVINEVSNAQLLNTGLFQLEMGRSTVVYVAHGEVWAGVNLEQLQEEDIRVNGKDLQIHLPPAHILNPENVIVEERSELRKYDEGLLQPEVFPLVDDLSKQAQAQILAHACNANILAEANRNAILSVEMIMHAAGFRNVVVETSMEKCP